MSQHNVFYKYYFLRTRPEFQNKKISLRIRQKLRQKLRQKFRQKLRQKNLS